MEARGQIYRPAASPPGIKANTRRTEV